MSSLSEIPDILLFMRRVGPVHAEQMASIAKHTKQSYNIICAWEEELTAPQALNRAIERSRSRWMCVLDDDVIILDDYWLRDLIGFLTRHDDFALVSPHEIKEADEREDYEIDHSRIIPPAQPLARECNWVPGYCTLFDRQKLGDIRCIETLSGRYGMSDVDLSLRVLKAGYRIAHWFGFAVYHPWKDTDEKFRRKYDMALDEEEMPLHKIHYKEMTEEWGEFFTSNYHRQLLGDIEGPE